MLVWWHESVVYLTIRLALLMSCLWLRCLYVRIWRPLLPYGLGTTIKHPVPDRVKTSLVIFDIRVLWRSALLCYSSVSVSACDWLTSHRTRDITSTATVCSLYVNMLCSSYGIVNYVEWVSTVTEKIMWLGLTNPDLDARFFIPQMFVNISAVVHCVKPQRSLQLSRLFSVVVLLHCECLVLTYHSML